MKIGSFSYKLTDFHIHQLILTYIIQIVATRRIQHQKLVSNIWLKSDFDSIRFYYFLIIIFLMSYFCKKKFANDCKHFPCGIKMNKNKPFHQKINAHYLAIQKTSRLKISVYQYLDIVWCQIKRVFFSKLPLLKITALLSIAGSSILSFNKPIYW